MGCQVLQFAVAHLALHCWGASAWSAKGHERIAQISKALLAKRQREQVDRMLQGSLVGLSNWEETMTAQHPETDALHWHRQHPEWTCRGPGARRSAASTTPPAEGNFFHAVADLFLEHIGDRRGLIRCDGHGAEGGSLFCALAYFFEHFAHEALLKEFPEPKEPINTPGTLLALSKFSPGELEASHYLRWLAVLIGDLHQPLHWLREHGYGKDIKVVYMDKEYTLLSVWEELIPQHLPALGSERQLQKQYQEQSPAWWDKVPQELFREWAKDMAEKLCQNVYEAMELGGANETQEVQSPFRLHMELFQKWVRLGEEFTTLGGERLAFVLNEILEHRRHKAAHKDGRGRHHRRKNWTRSLAINASISIVVVPFLLGTFWIHLRSGGSGILSRVTHLKA